MGLFDTLASKAIGSVLGGGQQEAAGGADIGGLISSVMSGKVDLQSTLGTAMSAMGGIEGIQAKFKDSGLGDQFSSWVGKGENAPVSADQLKQAIGGTDAVAGVAKSLGLDVNALMPLLATMLPTIIDKLTPHGEVDQASSQGSGLQAALGQLVGGGNIASLLGNAVGGNLGGLVGGLLGGNKA